MAMQLNTHESARPLPASTALSAAPAHEPLPLNVPGVVITFDDASDELSDNNEPPEGRDGHVSDSGTVGAHAGVLLMGYIPAAEYCRCNVGYGTCLSESVESTDQMHASRIKPASISVSA